MQAMPAAFTRNRSYSLLCRAAGCSAFARPAGPGATTNLVTALLACCHVLAVERRPGPGGGCPFRRLPLLTPSASRRPRLAESSASVPMQRATAAVPFPRSLCTALARLRTGFHSWHAGAAFALSRVGRLILCTSSWLQEHGAGCSSIEVRAQPGTLSTVRSPRPRLPSMQWISSFPERRARVLSFPGAAYAQLHHSQRFPHSPAAQLDALCIVFPAGLGACWSGSPSLCARVMQSRAWHAARIIRAQQSGVRCRSDIWTSPAASASLGTQALSSMQLLTFTLCIHPTMLWPLASRDARKAQPSHPSRCIGKLMNQQPPSLSEEMCCIPCRSELSRPLETSPRSLS